MKKHLNIKRTADKVEIWISDEFYNFFHYKRYYIHNDIIKSYDSIIKLESKLNLKCFVIYRVLIGNSYNDTDLYDSNLTLHSTINKEETFFKASEYSLNFPPSEMKEHSERFYKNTSIILVKMFEYFKQVKLRERDHLFDYLEIYDYQYNEYDRGESLDW